MSPNLERISRKARANPELVFTSLYHPIADIDHLRTCDQRLKGNKAVGMDEVTKSMYAVEACSYGYRPERSLHQCLDVLGRPIRYRKKGLVYLSLNPYDSIIPSIHSPNSESGQQRDRSENLTD